MLSISQTMSANIPPRRRPDGPYYAAGQVIKSLRLKLGLSQSGLAERYGATQGYISNVERGFENIVNAGADWYQRMSEALEVDVQALMQAIGVPYVVGESFETRYVDGSQGDYVTVTLTVSSNDPIASPVLASIPVPVELAHKDLAAHFVASSQVAVLPSGVYAIYSRTSPAPDDVVAFVYADDAGRELIYFGYYTQSGEVELDSPLAMHLPLRLRPRRVLGVLETYMASIRPRRPSTLA